MRIADKSEGHCLSIRPTICAGRPREFTGATGLQEAVREAGVAVDTSFGLGVTVDKTEGQEGRVHLVHIGQTAEGTCGVRAALSLVQEC